MKEQNLTGEDVLALTATYMPEEDVAFVQKALDYSVEAHKEQSRKSGEPYIIHPIQVAGILAGLKLDAVTVACGFLHDVVEDTDVTLEEIERHFNKEVARIVDGLTKISGIFDLNNYNSSLQAENFRKLLLAVIEKFSGGPVGLDNLAHAIGEESETIEDVLEPFLIQQGYLQRTPRGRIATLAAFRHLGVAPTRQHTDLFGGLPAA